MRVIYSSTELRYCSKHGIHKRWCLNDSLNHTRSVSFSLEVMVPLTKIKVFAVKRFWDAMKRMAKSVSVNLPLTTLSLWSRLKCFTCICRAFRYNSFLRNKLICEKLVQFGFVLIERQWWKRLSFYAIMIMNMINNKKGKWFFLRSYFRTDSSFKLFL